MSILQPFLAQDILPTEVLPESWHWMGLSLEELLIMLGAVTLVTLLLVLWAVYVRKGPRAHSHRHHRHHRHHQDDSPELNNTLGVAEDPDSEADSEKGYRRKRRRRREHRPRNPTLAETGGLPPLRSERPPDTLP